MNALDAVTEAVATLTDALPGLLDACTDPQATDMAELLWLIQQSRVELQAMEREVEDTCARAMLSDDVRTDTLVVERHRSTDRKAWDHDAWKHDARNKVLRALGLAGAQGVLSADGEVLDASVLWDALARLQSVHGSAAPKVTALRELGLDARDYCETSPGAWHVKVRRMADMETETEGAA